MFNLIFIEAISDNGIDNDRIEFHFIIIAIKS